MTTKTIDYSMFVLGAALGASLAWYFTKKKYEEILQDDKVVLTSKDDFSEKQSQEYQKNKYGNCDPDKKSRMFLSIIGRSYICR